MSGCLTRTLSQMSTICLKSSRIRDGGPSESNKYSRRPFQPVRPSFAQNCAFSRAVKSLSTSWRNRYSWLAVWCLFQQISCSQKKNIDIPSWWCRHLRLTSCWKSPRKSEILNRLPQLPVKTFSSPNIGKHRRLYVGLPWNAKISRTPLLKTNCSKKSS